MSTHPKSTPLGKAYWRGKKKNARRNRGRNASKPPEVPESPKTHKASTDPKDHKDHKDPKDHKVPKVPTVPKVPKDHKVPKVPKDHKASTVTKASKAPSPNKSQWPSTEHYPTWLCHLWDKFLESSNIAATKIATAWRNRGRATKEPDGDAAKPPSAAYTTLRDVIAAAKFGHAEVKLDGTNVGKDAKGDLYGRRQKILANATSYQKTSLRDVRAANVGAVQEAVLSALATTAPKEEMAALGACHFVVYGELMCNAELYDYAETGLAGAWLAFGVVVQSGAEHTARTFATAAKNAGFAASDPRPEEDDDGGKWKVQLCGNPLLQNIFRDAGLKVPEVVGGASSDETLVRCCAPFMMDQRGEGVVVTLPGAGKDGGSILRKWKIGTEAQYSSVKLLKETKAKLDANPYLRSLIEPYARAVDLMWEILEKTGGGETPKAKKELSGPTPAEVKDMRNAAYAAAWKSALTKFGHTDEQFDAGKTRPEVIEDLLGEMIGDDDLKKHILNEKHLKKFVAAMVGKAYGEWKSKKSSD